MGYPAQRQSMFWPQISTNSVPPAMDRAKQLAARVGAWVVEAKPGLITTTTTIQCTEKSGSVVFAVAGMYRVGSVGDQGVRPVSSTM